MKKKVKKIPKYSNGTISADVLDKAMAGKFKTPDVGSTQTKPMASLYQHSKAIGGGTGSLFGGNGGATDSGGGIGWGAIGAAATQIGKGMMHSFGVEDNSQLGVTLNNSMEWAELGGSIVPGWGHLIGGVAGATFGAFQKGGVDPNTGEIKYGGIFGRSKDSLLAEQNMVKNNIRATQMTEQKKAEYAMNPNNPNGGAVMAAEGGIMRRPVDALVSKGELIYDPTTQKLRQVPGSKGKPNRADDVFARLYEGDVVISNSPTMLMANGKTPALNLMGMVDKYATGGTVKAREAIIKKVVNWLEANKTKPQEYAKFDGGGIAKYGYNKNLEEFEYWDKTKKEYKKEYTDWVNAITEQDVKDIFDGNYGDMSTYKGVNANYIPTVEEARKLMTDKKYGDWHKIGKAVVDSKIKNNLPPTAIDAYQLPIYGGTISEQEMNFTDSGKPLIVTRTPGVDKPVLKTLPNPSAADGSRAARKYLSKQNTPNWLDEMSNLLPVIGGLFDKYDWHTESSQITPPRFVPVNADPRPLLRAADESLAMARYNQANISPNTGAGMAYGLQAASNRAKAYADAYQWQQETNNKLIAQNAGIYNDWRRQRDAYATQAIADTRANEGAAQQMEDQAREDRLEFYYGKRNDDMLTAMLEPMFEYGTPDKAYRLIYKRRIV